MPKRIQLRRTKGWRKPAGAVNCARPSVFGNPYVGPGAVEAFRRGLTETLKAMRGEGGSIPIAGTDFSRVIDDPEAHFRRMAERLPELRDKDCCCWCALDRERHVDVILEVANG